MSHNTQRATEAREEYLKAFPLLAAYLDIMHEHNTRTAPINEPPTEPHGLDNHQIAAMALQRIGRPARDRYDIQMADAWIHKLNDELEELSPEPERTVTDWVIHALYSLSEFVPSADDWERMSADDQSELLDEVFETIPHDDQIEVFTEVLRYAMPGILAEITRQDQHHLRAVVGTHG